MNSSAAPLLQPFTLRERVAQLHREQVLARIQACTASNVEGMQESHKQATQALTEYYSNNSNKAQEYRI